MYVEDAGVALWFGTEDAPAPTGMLDGGEHPNVTVGVRPVDELLRPTFAGAVLVWVEFRIGDGDVQRSYGLWRRDDAARGSQYHVVELPPLASGTQVEYSVHCRIAGREVAIPGPVSFIVRSESDEPPRPALTDDSDNQGIPDFSVTAPSDPTGADADGVHVSPESVTVPLGSSVILNAAAEGEGAVAGVALEWGAYDANGRAVPISSSGEFPALTPGTFKVVARIRGEHGRATVVVPDPTATAGSADDGSVPLAVPLGALAAPEEARREWNDRNAGSAFEARNRRGPSPAEEQLSVALGGSRLLTRRDALTDPGEISVAGNGAFTLSAPVIRLPGRGLDLNLDLSYQSLLWHQSGSEIVYDIDAGWPAPGWSLGFGKIVRLGGQGSMIVGPDGVRHPFDAVSLTGNQSAGRWEFTGRTTDGTLIDYSHVDDVSGGLQSATARFPDGTVMEYTARGHDVILRSSGQVLSSWGVLFPTRITDRNGNQITITYRDNRGPEIDTIIDTLGRAVRFHYDGEGALTAITAPRLGGGTRTLLRLSYMLLRLEFAFAGLDALGPRRARMVRAIYQPGTRTGYWFGDPFSFSSYGMVRHVRRQREMGFNDAPLTEQGEITRGTSTQEWEYNYPGTADPTLSQAPTYTTMTESWQEMDTAPAITTYQVTESASGRTVEITLPDGSRTVQVARRQPGSVLDGLPSQLDRLSGATLLQRSTVTWEEGDYRSPRLSRIETTDERQQTTATEYSYGPYNQLAEIREYGYGPGNLLRRRRMEYVSDSGYLDRHILALRSAVEVFAGYEMSPVARTEYRYDTEPLLNTPGVVGHSTAHDPYAPREWVPPHDETDCDPTERPPCTTTHFPGYWLTEYDRRTRFRGNLTQVTSYADASRRELPLTEIRTYDITGNLRTISGPGSRRSAFEYSSATQYAYVTSRHAGATDPNSTARITATAGYDLGTGLIVMETDANGRTRSREYDPESLDLVAVTGPSVGASAGPTLRYSHDRSALRVTETIEVITSTGDDTDEPTLVAQRDTWSNGLELPRRRETLAGATDATSGLNGPGPTTDVTLLRYDVMGRLWQRSRPFRDPDSPVWETLAYDGLGREVRRTSADGSQVQTLFDEPIRPSDASPAPGRTARIIDPWGRERWCRWNALGQLEEVVEPNPNGSGSVFDAGHTSTYYLYSAMDQLTGIVSYPGPQNRWFAYDGVGRLTHQYLPERAATLTDTGQYRQPGARWSDVWRYDTSTQPIISIDARGVRAIYDRGDPLGRLLRILHITRTAGSDQAVEPVGDVQIEYVLTGDVNRPARISSQHGVHEFQYDTDGRLTATIHSPRGHSSSFEVGYGYDELDRVVSLLYPTRSDVARNPRRTIDYTYDLAGRISVMQVNGVSAATGLSYTPSGQLASGTFGSGRRQTDEQYDYDPLTGFLQRHRADRSDPSRRPATLLDVSFSHQRPGLPGQSGQLTAVEDSLNESFSRQVAYDALGRIASVQGGAPSSPAWTQTYGYDRHGNRLTVVATGTDGDSAAIPADGLPNLTYDASTNRITSEGFQYDEAGNLTRGRRTGGTWQRYRYDAAGRLVAVADDLGNTIESYGYGATRRRLWTDTPGIGRIYHVWAGDRVVAEHTGDITTRASTWSRELIYLGRRLIATYWPTARGEAVEHRYSDGYGQIVLTQGPDSTPARLVTLPFGVPLTSPDQTDHRFGGYDRSAATGLDYAINRVYGPESGRFLQVDPAGVTPVVVGNSQGLNGYLYAANDPVNAVDPLGLRWITIYRGGYDVYVGGTWVYGVPYQWSTSIWVEDEPSGERDPGSRRGEGRGGGLGRVREITEREAHEWIFGPSELVTLYHVYETLEVAVANVFAQLGATVAQLSILPFQPFVDFGQLEDETVWRQVQDAFNYLYGEIWGTNPPTPAEAREQRAQERFLQWLRYQSSPEGARDRAREDFYRTRAGGG